jgi:hypothetical protein
MQMTTLNRTESICSWAARLVHDSLCCTHNEAEALAPKPD